MKKTAQLLKDHIAGKETVASTKLVNKLAGMLKQHGFSGPIRITKISEQYLGVLDLEGAYTTLGVNAAAGAPDLAQLNLIKQQEEQSLKRKFMQEGGGMDRYDSYLQRMELIQDAYDTIVENLGLNSALPPVDNMEETDPLGDENNPIGV